MMIAARCLRSVLAVAAALSATEPVPPGMIDAGFLQDLDGRSRALREPAWSGRVLLVSFVAIWSARPGDRPNPNRSQAVFIRSIGSQFASDGLKTLIVGVPPAGMTHGELRNVGLAWGTDVVEIAVDPQGAVARSHDVDRYPTTLLLDAADRVVKRWEGLAPTHELASAIGDQLHVR